MTPQHNNYSLRQIILITVVLMVACLAITIQEYGALMVVQGDTWPAYTIEVGEFRMLTPADRLKKAVAKLSKEESQQAWWALADAPWHDSALARYFQAGPLGKEEMEKLANHSGTANPWNSSDIRSAEAGSAFIFTEVVEHLSSVSFTKLSQLVSGIGTINASMSAMFFLCFSDSGCKAGYMVPLIITDFRGTSSTSHSTECDHEDQVSNYATLWLPAPAKLLLNAHPASIGRATIYKPQRPTAVRPPIDPNDCMLLSAHQNLPSCKPSPVLGFRSHLDAAYGLMPGAACMQMTGNNNNHSQHVRFLVFLFLSDTNNATRQSADTSSLLSAHKFFNLTGAQWHDLPFDECANDAVLIMEARKLTEESVVTMCLNDTCVEVVASDVFNTTTCMGSMSSNSIHFHLEGFLFLRSVLRLQSCRFENKTKLERPANYLDTKLSGSVTCDMPHNATCTAVLRNFYTVNSTTMLEAVFYAGYSENDTVQARAHFSHKSNWSFSQGAYTGGFRWGPAHMNNGPCIITIPSSDLVAHSTDSSLINLIHIHAREALTSFIEQHSIAFTMKYGTATDLQNFIVLIVSTAISVLFGFGGPSFTDFLLRKISSKYPRHLAVADSIQTHSARISWMLTYIRVSWVPVICNLALSVCSFLPVLYVAWSEAEREKIFYTWDLGSHDVAIYIDDPVLPVDDAAVRVVYVLSGSSQYASNFSTVAALVAAVVWAAVVVCALWRCKKILNRYSLLWANGPTNQLMNYSGEGTSYLTDFVQQLDEGAQARIQALRAIEMTETEAMIISQALKAQY